MNPRRLIITAHRFEVTLLLGCLVHRRRAEATVSAHACAHRLVREQALGLRRKRARLGRVPSPVLCSEMTDAPEKPLIPQAKGVN